MKTLHINTYDIEGGAARAVYRLHKALLSIDIDSQMLVQSKTSDDFTILTETGRLRKILTRFNPHIDSIPTRFYKNRIGTLFSPASYSFGHVIDKINKINPDIVHLHWVCGGMITIEDIAKIKAPIVWTLHDNWAFAGGCHIMWDCNKYQDKCGNCFVLGSNSTNDLSNKVFKRKEKTFQNIDKLTIIGVSNWLKNCSEKSYLLNDRKHYSIGNPIDTNIFKPFDKEKARELWNLPKNKKLVLFGAMSATSDKNKGFKELSDAISKMVKTLDIEFVIFGSSRPQNAPDFGFKIHYLGKLADDVSLVTLYSAVDVMVVPSIQEAFGQTASEAMSCGTPVVAFGATGLLDIVDHKINGYLAQPYCATDLKTGIEWIVNNENYNELCKNARKKTISEFDSKVVANKYINLYKEILSE